MLLNFRVIGSFIFVTDRGVECIVGGLENKENKLETQDVCQKIYLYSVLATSFTDQLL